MTPVSTIVLLSAFLSLACQASPPPTWGQRPLPCSAQWQTRANITVAARQEHSTVYLPEHDSIAIIGGIIPNNSAVPIPFTTTDLVQLYSIKEDAWRTLAPLPLALNHVNAAVADGKIYAFGGLDGGGEAQEYLEAIADSWVYNLAENSWSALPPLPSEEARGMAGVAVYKGKIYLAGGFTRLGMRGQGVHDSVSPVSVFDIHSSTWVTESLPAQARNLPAPRDHAGTFLIGSKMYIIGGYDHGAENSRDTVFILDLEDLEAGWRQDAAKMPTARGGMTAATPDDERLFTFGGEYPIGSPVGVHNEVEVYNVKCNKWIELGLMPLPKHSAPGVAVRGEIYLPGGGLDLGGAPTDSFDVYVPAKEEGAC